MINLSSVLIGSPSASQCGGGKPFSLKVRCLTRNANTMQTFFTTESTHITVMTMKATASQGLEEENSQKFITKSLHSRIPAPLGEHGKLTSPTACPLVPPNPSLTLLPVRRFEVRQPIDRLLIVHLLVQFFAGLLEMLGELIKSRGHPCDGGE